MVRNKLVYGSFSTSGSGRFLSARVVKHDRGYVFYDAATARDLPMLERRARQIFQDEADERPEEGPIYSRYRSELGLSEAEADEPIFIVRVILSSVFLREQVNDPVRSLAAASGMAFLLAILLAVVASQLAIKPLERIGEAIDRITKGEVDLGAGGDRSPRSGPSRRGSGGPRRAWPRRRSSGRRRRRAASPHRSA